MFLPAILLNSGFLVPRVETRFDPSPGGKKMSVASEASAIPFGALIGGPLTAAIEAQSQAAVASLDFIKAVGFTEEKSGKKEVQNITFVYAAGGQEPQTLEVPLLTILPIPFLRIDDMTVQFKASISQSMETEDKKSSVIESGAKAEVSGGYPFVKASLTASVSAKKDSSSTQTSKYAVEYTIDVSVHAVQDDMPAGLGRVLNILNESIDRQLQARPSESNEEPKPKPQS